MLASRLLFPGPKGRICERSRRWPSQAMALPSRFTVTTATLAILGPDSPPLPSSYSCCRARIPSLFTRNPCVRLEDNAAAYVWV
jgi:hypothetical protein